MKTVMPLEVARVYANEIIAKLNPLCKRIEIAGSIRRGKAEIGDIELVAIPKPRYDMFGVEIEEHELDCFDWKTIGVLVEGRHKYKKIQLYQNIQLDLFIVTKPAQWGVVFLIRTGSADFSHRLVTSKQHGGLMPSNFRVQDGAVWSNNHIIKTPEETNVFDLIGVPFIAPEMRLK